MEVRLPRLGEGADSGAVSSVLVKIGEKIGKDQPLLELESEKAVASIPSPSAGVVTGIHVKEGDQVKVGQVLVSLDEAVAPAVPSREKFAAPAISVAPSGRLVAHESASAPAVQARPAPPAGFPPPAAPSVRKLARELGIDLHRVPGSERGGRITMEDLRTYLRNLQESSGRPAGPAEAPAAGAQPAHMPDFSRWGPVERTTLSMLRQTISRRMAESWTSVPHVTQFDEADITALAKLRAKHAPAYEKAGVRLTLTPFLMKALADVLKDHPKFNASLDLAAGAVIFKQYYSIGVAVDTPQGLMVPVIREVDRKSMLELSRELQDLASRARERKITLEEMQGGTFTISNQGGIGGGAFTPIINVPEVAILGVARSVGKPVASGRKVAVRTMLPLSVSYDHRVIDGADAARFITAFVQRLTQFRDKDVKLR